MKLEQQVCSLELSKRLKELGVKQNSHFSWEELFGKPEYRLDVTIHGEHRVSAFTVAELGEMLPEDIHTNGAWYFFRHYKWNGGKGTMLQYRSNTDHTLQDQKGVNMAEAYGLMLEYLITNNLMTV